MDYKVTEYHVSGSVKGVSVLKKITEERLKRYVQVTRGIRARAIKNGPRTRRG